MASMTNSTTQLLPSDPSVPVNSQQIHSMIANSNDKDMIFYEYEIVDKDKEAKWANRQARKYGLCLCSRWLFMLLGNGILIAITCAICAILLYVNTPNDVTIKPLTFGETCETGSTNCDKLRNLVCTSEKCQCYSNYVWNGTDCVCTTDQYWDGLACLKNQGYQQPCSSSVPCYSRFTCDQRTSTCLCASASTLYYTQFYTGLVTDLYGDLGGRCEPKLTYAQACSTYGVKSCKDYEFLTCAVGPGNFLQCFCYDGYFWNGTYCIAKGKSPGFNCALNPPLGCDLSTGMFCDTTQTPAICSCATNQFWNNDTAKCEAKRGYQQFCYNNNWCNSTISLVCYQPIAMGVCNCPTTSSYWRCDCTNNGGTTQYWDGQRCTNRVGLNQPCPGQYACSAGTCLYGYCL